MSIFDDLTTDLDWRETELGSLRILLSRKDVSKTQKEVLLRASWAMLYAHYEGFSKFCLSTFYDEASKRLLNCETLPPRTKAFALDKQLKRLKSLPSLDLLNELEVYPNLPAATKPNFPEVDTKSNLWPNVMRELLLDADIIIDALDAHAVKLNTLVTRRNGIAHGQKNFIDEVDYYFTYENAVYDVLYHLAYSVDDRLKRAPYAV